MSLILLFSASLNWKIRYKKRLHHIFEYAISSLTDLFRLYFQVVFFWYLKEKHSNKKKRFTHKQHGKINPHLRIWQPKRTNSVSIEQLYKKLKEKNIGCTNEIHKGLQVMADWEPCASTYFVNNHLLFILKFSQF